MSITPDRRMTPVAFDRDGLRLNVDQEVGSTPPMYSPPQIQEELLTPSGPRSTLAVLVIKPHATKQRLKIEKRISEAGFEILKERKMGFHLDSQGVVEMFGADAPSLCGEPVWVYVLSRPRSASALTALAGPIDPLVARRSDPESLRALYGSNRWENGVWTTKDDAAAERIISELFAGSPIMELSDLPSIHSSPDRPKIRKTPSHASSLKSHLTTSTETKSTSAPNSRGASLPPPSKPAFKARPVPASTTSPSIVPRTTRAASLRAGKPVTSPSRPRMSQEERERTFEGVPGHKRRESITVASTAPPAIAPRPNRSAILRAQKLAEGDKPKPAKFPSTSSTKEKVPLSPEELEEKQKATFEGVPGHKRRESISVASTAPPAVAPRVNRSSMLRAQKMQANGAGGAPPSSFKAASDNGPTRSLSTRSSQGSIGAASSGSTRRASIAVTRPSPASVSKASNRLSLVVPRGSNAGGGSSLISNGAKSPGSTATPPAPANGPKTSPKKPDIVPRTNKSALLRAAAKLKNATGGSVGKGPSARKSLAI
ncbi:Nucleoside diphosphate kinase [Ceratobasidium theobromae]|uniref:Nucleoside diphosphate kinase n=1 Tax=Ceratobasidium theobromae TaxID=1582974 RepID=A0A5N5QPF9_9AGAM|nr:Nucleoside diphosphate kinase [Ceratobasidium theobromae]